MNNNVWYLDRGKNFFTKEGIDFYETFLALFNDLSIDYEVPSSKVIENMPLRYKNSGNPNALLTTLRNIGIIDKNNKLTLNSKYYLNCKMTYKELIFENLSNINYSKDKDNTVKPLFIIIMILYTLFMIDPSCAYITKKDCIKYLYEITDYKEHTFQKVGIELSQESRDYSNFKDPVLDIWFNALNEYDFFVKIDKNLLRINENKINFYKRVYDFCVNKDPKEVNDISDIIPEIPELNDDFNIEEANVESIYNYLFGIKNDINYNYFSKDCYGCLKGFDVIKNIAIRKINNDVLSNYLYSYTYYIDKDEDYLVQEDDYDQNNYIEDFIYVINNGKYSTTYKIAWAQGIINIIRNEKVIIEEDRYHILFKDLAKEFLVFYIAQIQKGNYYHSSNMNNPEIYTLTNHFYNKLKILNIVDNRIDANEYERIAKNELIQNENDILLEKIIKVLKRDVCYRFLNVNDNSFELYQYEENDDKISFNRNQVEAIKNNYLYIQKAIDEKERTLIELFSGKKFKNDTSVKEKDEKFYESIDNISNEGCRRILLDIVIKNNIADKNDLLRWDYKNILSYDFDVDTLKQIVEFLDANNYVYRNCFIEEYEDDSFLEYISVESPAFYKMLVEKKINNGNIENVNLLSLIDNFWNINNIKAYIKKYFFIE